MLLSEAIRLGCLLGPQVLDSFVEPGDGSCALGAAMLTMNIKPEINVNLEQGMPEELRRTFPGLGCDVVLGLFDVLRLQRPATDIGDVIQVEDFIIEMNDDGYYHREQIADWLVESGNDCSSVETAPAPEIAAALVSAHMVAR